MAARGGAGCRRGTRDDDDGCGGTQILSDCPGEAPLEAAGMSRAVPSRAPGWGGTASRPPKGAGEPSWVSGAAEGPPSVGEAVGLMGGAVAKGKS